MPARLDNQRHSKRPHRRFNHRFYVRGHAIIPHDVWGDWGDNRATGANAGTPGALTPGGSETPYTLHQLRAWGVVASPGTAWTTGQRIVLGDGATAHWNGTAWTAGNAP